MALRSFVIVLLDTHALLWALDASPRLSATARDVIEDTGNIVLVSVASAWEIEIKKALGQLEAPDDLEDAIEAAGFLKRPVTFADVRHLDVHAGRRDVPASSALSRSPTFATSAPCRRTTRIRSIACSSRKPSWKVRRWTGPAGRHRRA